MLVPSSSWSRSSAERRNSSTAIKCRLYMLSASNVLMFPQFMILSRTTKPWCPTFLTLEMMPLSAFPGNSCSPSSTSLTEPSSGVQSIRCTISEPSKTRMCCQPRLKSSQSFWKCSEVPVISTQMPKSTRQAPEPSNQCSRAPRSVREARKTVCPPNWLSSWISVPRGYAWMMNDSIISFNCVLKSIKT